MVKTQEQKPETLDYRAIWGRASLVFGETLKKYAVLAASAENAMCFTAFLSWAYKQLENGVEIDDLGMAGLGIMVEVLSEEAKAVRLAT
jgi:hypothetical protein